MAIERTLTIIKPDAVAAGHAGDIIKMFEANDFKIVAARLVSLSKKEAEGFYAVHRGKPFFESLTTFMSSGRALVMVLEGENAIARLREVMGATNPANAAPGTIRRLYGAGSSTTPSTARTPPRPPPTKSAISSLGWTWLAEPERPPELRYTCRHPRASGGPRHS